MTHAPEALMAMLQTELFDAMVAIGEMDDESLSAMDRFGLMAGAAKNIAALASASTTEAISIHAQRQDG